MISLLIKALYHLISIVSIPFTIKYFYDYFTKSKGLQKKSHHLVIFFPDQGLINTTKENLFSLSKLSSPSEDQALFKNVYIHSNFRDNFERSTSLVNLLEFIEDAKKSLDLCLLIFTLNELEEALTRAKERGVAIRIIIDKTMSECDGSSIPTLVKEDILVVRGPPNVMVNHKFVLADATSDGVGAVATGSLNWTWGSISASFENLIISNNPELVTPFKKEFDRLWVAFLS